MEGENEVSGIMEVWNRALLKVKEENIIVASCGSTTNTMTHIDWSMQLQAVTSMVLISWLRMGLSFPNQYEKGSTGTVWKVWKINGR